MKNKIFIECEYKHGGMLLEKDNFGLMNISHLEVSPANISFKDRLRHA
jgi:hypothetical protein